MVVFIALRHPLTILVTTITRPNNLTNNLLTLKPLDNKQILSYQMVRLDRKTASFNP